VAVGFVAPAMVKRGSREDAWRERERMSVMCRTGEGGACVWWLRDRPRHSVHCYLLLLWFVLLLCL